MKYLNHTVKTRVPKQFLELGLVDYSYKNDAVGCMGHPRIENYLVYPVRNYTEALENDTFSETPEKWFVFNPNCPEDSVEDMTVDDVVKLFKSLL